MRRDAERLQDILEALDSVAQMIAGRTEEEFLTDTTLCYAVAHRLTVVGEAAGPRQPCIDERESIGALA